MARTEQYDFNVEGYDNLWQAIGAVSAGGYLADEDIRSIKFLGPIYNGNPTVEIEFKTVEACRKFTAEYLGVGSPNSQDVDEYLAA